MGAAAQREDGERLIAAINHADCFVPQHERGLPTSGAAPVSVEI
jgi:hypothetical protein